MTDDVGCRAPGGVDLCPYSSNCPPQQQIMQIQAGFRGNACVFFEMHELAGSYPGPAAVWAGQYSSAGIR